MGWIVDDIAFFIDLEGILKGIGDICNTNYEALSGCKRNDNAEDRGIKYQGERLVKIYTF